MACPEAFTADTQNRSNKEPPQPQWIEGSMSFALRTTTAALLALLASASLGIEHPWWSAMTVWLVTQPFEGLLLERTLARLAGSVVGASVGCALLLGLGGQLWLLLLSLALWLALCAGLGSIFQHSRNYVFVLAGYTASIVVMFGLGEGVFSRTLAEDRILCTFIGIACSALAFPRSLSKVAYDKLCEHHEALLGRCLQHVEHYLHYGRSACSVRPLIADLAEMVNKTQRIGLYTPQINQVYGLLLELLVLTRDDENLRETVPSRHHTSQAPESGPSALSQDAPLSKTVIQSAISQALEELLDVLHRPAARRVRSIFRDVDMSSVIRASFRPVIGLSVAAVIWLSTGWQAGSMMVMTATLFTSLFSNNINGNLALIHVMMGSLLGACFGLFVRQFLLPEASEFWMILLCIFPFLLLGAWLMRHLSTGKMAIDMNMTFLLIAQPASAPTDLMTALNESAAILTGVIIAVVTYWLLMPATPQLSRNMTVRHVVKLANRVSQTSEVIHASRTHGSLRAALVRLLNQCEPTDKIFMAAQNCMVLSREVLLTHSPSFPNIDPLSKDNLSPMQNAAETLRNAGTELLSSLDDKPTDGSFR